MIYLGIDGCRAGWVVAAIDEQQQLSIRLTRQLSAIEELDATCIYIDIPIHFAGQQYRACEVAAQRLLGPQKRTSIFLTPCREAVYAETFAEANRINKEQTGKGVSMQAWNIFPKIKEAVAFRDNSQLPLLEAHPELCFAYLNDQQPLLSKKADPQGITDRLKLIEAVSSSYEKIIEETLRSTKRNEVKADDILDAVVLAIRAASGQRQAVLSPTAAVTGGNIFF